MEQSNILKACLHISHAKYYFDYAASQAHKEAKHRINIFNNKLDYIITSLRDCLSPDARKIYDEEIIKGDPVFFAAISDKLLHLNPGQRDGVEQLVDALLSGETIIVEKA